MFLRISDKQNKKNCELPIFIFFMNKKKTRMGFYQLLETYFN